MNTGIYKIENTENGKSYYGSACNMKSRWRTHRSRLMNNKHENIKLQSAWNKYGVGAFKFIPIIICQREDLLFYEQRVLDGYQSVKFGYNICGIAGNCSGVIQSKEAREKKAAAMRGRKFSLETRAKLSMALKGKPKSQKVVDLLRSYNEDRVFTAEHLRNLSIAKKGRRHSYESRKKMSLAKMGHPVSQEARKKMSLKKKGVPKPPRTPEHCAKISANKKEFWRKKRELKVE